jgi:hypothetical protein
MSNSNPDPFLRNLLRGLEIPSKPRVFVSFHHGNDRWYADRFSQLFHEQYEAVTDRSLETAIDSQNSEYVYRRIREEFINGTSCTVVLCGADTGDRKHVDWEIKATLDMGHGLLGVILPTCRRNMNGHYMVPDRLNENVQSGYANWIHWTDVPAEMLQAINDARARSAKTALIRNAAPMMSRNR